VPGKMAPVPGSWHQPGHLCQEAGTAGRPEDAGTGAVTRHDSSTSPMTDKARTSASPGRAANLPGTPTLDPCQKPGTGARLRCQLVWHGTRDPEFVSFSGFRVAEVDSLGVALAGLLDVEVRYVRGTVEETDNLAGIGDRPSRDNPQVSVLGQ